MRVQVAVLRDALATALVVGPVLTLINHGDTMAAGGALPSGKVALTFLVPFTVATVAGLRASHRRELGR
ncbi:MAG: nitrate/nitrite transporter NrtS [Pseudomonadota bacterium]